MVEQQRIDAFAQWFKILVDNIGTVIKGKDVEIGLALVCMFAEGHLLLEDMPGTGKTTLAKSIARSFGGESKRIQFTPDMLPADVTGGLVFDQHTGDFRFVAGPVFSHVVLADEINRASPKTQAALLEAMEERQVTTGTSTRPLHRPFLVIATQNPVEQAGTYPLPEAQLDRFLMRTSLGYPDARAESEVLRTIAEGVTSASVESIMTIENVVKLIDVAARVHLEESIRDYIVGVCAATRTMPELRLGVSTRGCIALMKASRALAASQARVYVTADDVKTVAHAVMEHRMLLTLDAELEGVRTADLVDRAFETQRDVLTPVRAER
jgi:MoxR-like ATPase